MTNVALLLPHRMLAFFSSDASGTTQSLPYCSEMLDTMVLRRFTRTLRLVCCAENLSSVFKSSLGVPEEMTAVTGTVSVVASRVRRVWPVPCFFLRDARRTHIQR